MTTHDSGTTIGDAFFVAVDMASNALDAVGIGPYGQLALAIAVPAIILTNMGHAAAKTAIPKIAGAGLALAIGWQLMSVWNGETHIPDHLNPDTQIRIVEPD